MRILLFSGKGGVGKTSLAAATGVRLAELGQRTLVMSVDPAHSLADCFDLDAGQHFQAARIEVLKGLRALLDARIEQASRSRSKPRGTKIKVV